MLHRKLDVVSQVVVNQHLKIIIKINMIGSKFDFRTLNLPAPLLLQIGRPALKDMGQLEIWLLYFSGWTKMGPDLAYREGAL